MAHSYGAVSSVDYTSSECMLSWTAFGANFAGVRQMRFILGVTIGLLLGYGVFGRTLYLDLKKYDPTAPQYLYIDPAEEAFCLDLMKVMGSPQCVEIRNYQHWVNVAEFAVYTACAVFRDQNGEFNAEELKTACQFG